MSAAGLDELRQQIADQVRALDASYAHAIEIALRMSERQRQERIALIYRDRNEIVSKLYAPLAKIVAMLPPPPVFIADPAMLLP